MKTPSVHLNGTSREELATQQEKAYYALEAALDALQAAAPHARDFYVQGDEAFGIAAEEHRHRVAKVASVKKDIETIWQKIQGEEPDD